MNDNLKLRHPKDASRINLSEDWEVEYWTKALGVFEERPKRVVEEHGNSVEAVHSALGK